MWKLYVVLFLVLHEVCPLNAQLIRYSYRFNNTFAASAPDCGPDLVQSKAGGNCNAGNTPGMFVSDTLPFCVARRSVYHTNLHWGLMYPNAEGYISTTYTIHMYVKATNWGNLRWARIIDFSSTNDKDVGIYYERSTLFPNRCLRFWPTLGQVGECPFFQLNTYYLLSFTRNAATGKIDVYVNGVLFATYNDDKSDFVALAGHPVYFFRDDGGQNPCESGEANFAYLSLSNRYSSQTDILSVYNNICSIAGLNTADFSFSPNGSCTSGENITVKYTGNINPPGTDYLFNWDWDGGTVLSGSGMGPFVVNWKQTGVKNVRLTITGGACTTPVTNTHTLTVGSLLSQITAQPSNCTDQGRIVVAASGGTTPYSFSIDSLNYQSANTFTVPAGTYSVFIKDAGSCIKKDTTVVAFVNTLRLQTRSDTSICSGQPVTLSTTSNAASFSWLPAAGLNNQAVKDPVALPLSTTDYVVTATTGTCSLKDTVRITVAKPLSVSAAVSAAGCADKGVISLTSAGGQAPFQYSLDGAAYQASNVFQVPGGHYMVYAKDAFNCVGISTAEVPTVNTLTLSALRDTILCQGESVTLFTSSNATGFSWQPSTGLSNSSVREPVATPASSTAYVVTAITGSCILKDTVQITVSPPVSASASTRPATCSQNGTITVMATGGTAPFRFSVNSRDFQAENTFTVPAGLYTVYVKDASRCAAQVTATVDAETGVVLQTRSDTAICQGKTVRLTTESDATNFTWQPASGLDNPNLKAPQATPLTTTTYIVTAGNNNCIKKDTVTVTVYPAIVLSATHDTIVQAGVSFRLKAYTLLPVTGIAYEWIPPTGLNDSHIADPVAFLNDDQTYTVSARSPQGCASTATVKVQVIKKSDIYVPNGFTPNHDGHNDVLKPVCVGMTALHYFRIYDRWGRSVYSTAVQNQGWDGKVKGIEQPAAVYVWIAEGVTIQGNPIIRKGSFVLIR